jgi:xanthine dehydrogenase FAD-binding subunit
MRANRSKDVRLMSLALLDELKVIVEEPDGSLSVGAGATFTEIAECPLIAGRVPMLRTAALSLGGPQTQNVATIGGNICNGAVSADSAPSLLALDAVLELISAGGTRHVAITDFYIGPGKVDRRDNELLKRVILPIGRLKNWGGSYIKMSARKAMDISTLGSAAVCALGPDGRVSSASVALGTAGPTPMRCPEAEAVLTGNFLTEELLREAGRQAAAACRPRSSWRASEAYRRYLAEELSVRSFREAFEAAGGMMQ